jgi:hypothetical protein
MYRLSEKEMYGLAKARKIQAGVKHMKVCDRIQLGILLPNDVGAPLTPEKIKEIANDAVIHFYKNTYES